MRGYLARRTHRLDRAVSATSQTLATLTTGTGEMFNANRALIYFQAVNTA